MGNVFSSIGLRKPKRNTFNLSHDNKLTTKMGQLTPVLVQECMPGDKFNIQSETLIRFAPLVSPVMHNMKAYIHYFFVPNRIVWPKWEQFITGGQDGQPVPAAPYISNKDWSVGTLGDYLGLPTGVVIDKVSALPFAAYQACYNEYYRDQNLCDPVNYTLRDGLNAGDMDASLWPLRTRAWQHDYFTSCLPWAQKGDPVSLPVSDVRLKDGWDEFGIPGFESSVAGSRAIGGNLEVTGPGGAHPYSIESTGDPANAPLAYDPAGSLEAGTTTINELRRAFKLQEWFEKMARGGSRYVEQVLVHFGVKSSDARLQRPEFIGGTSQPVVISEVLQTSDTGGEQTPLGTMGGHGLSASSGKNTHYFCEEHGYIIGIMSIMPTTAYQQGVPRHFSRWNYLDYPWPTFAHIGEQEVKNKELYYDPADPDYNEGTFGYIPRYSECRYQPSRVAGEFRTSLNFWHLGRIFGNQPQLNKDFIECNPRTDIFAVSGEAYSQNIWCHVYNRVYASRALPKYGDPML